MGSYVRHVRRLGQREGDIWHTTSERDCFGERVGSRDHLLRLYRELFAAE